MPPLTAQTGNGIAAAGRVVVASLKAEPIKVSAEIKTARLAVCVACEYCTISKDGTAHRCSKCGCWLDGNVLCKACLATEDCPEKKWPKS